MTEKEISRIMKHYRKIVKENSESFYKTMEELKATNQKIRDLL